MLTKPDTCLGVGINYRGEIANDIISNIHKIDFVEFSTERFFVDANNINLQNIRNTVPIVLHGLTLSIGTDQPIDSQYLSKLTTTLSEINHEWFSEHIAITHVNNLEIRALTPVEFDEKNMWRIINKAKQIKKLSNKPFLLENITYYYSMPNNKLSEATFIEQIAKEADCGLLLDINNLYVNSVNHQYDPYKFLSQIPLERVIEVHLAGCDYIYDMLIDTHASCIKKEVIELFQYVCKRTKLNGVVIERDAKLDNFTDLLDEVDFVRKIINKNKHTGK